MIVKRKITCDNIDGRSAGKVERAHNNPQWIFHTLSADAEYTGREKKKKEMGKSKKQNSSYF